MKIIASGTQNSLVLFPRLQLSVLSMWLQQCACNKTVLPNTGHTTLQKALGDLIGFSARMSHAFCNLDISQFCLGSFGCVWLMHLTTGLVFWPTFHPPGVSESSDRAEGELQNTELMTRELTWWCSAKKEANEFFQNNAAKRHLTTQQRNKESERERESKQATARQKQCSIDTRILYKRRVQKLYN